MAEKNTTNLELITNPNNVDKNKWNSPEEKKIGFFSRIFSKFNKKFKLNQPNKKKNVNINKAMDMALGDIDEFMSDFSESMKFNKKIDNANQPQSHAPQNSQTTLKQATNTNHYSQSEQTTFSFSSNSQKPNVEDNFQQLNYPKMEDNKFEKPVEDLNNSKLNLNNYDNLLKPKNNLDNEDNLGLEDWKTDFMDEYESIQTKVISTNNFDSQKNEELDDGFSSTTTLKNFLKPENLVDKLNPQKLNSNAEKLQYDAKLDVNNFDEHTINQVSDEINKQQDEEEIVIEPIVEAVELKMDTENKNVNQSKEDLILDETLFSYGIKEEEMSNKNIALEKPLDNNDYSSTTATINFNETNDKMFWRPVNNTFNVIKDDLENDLEEDQEEIFNQNYQKEEEIKIEPIQDTNQLIVEDHEEFLNEDLQIDDEIKNETSQEIVQQENSEVVTKAKMIEEIPFTQEEIKIQPIQDTNELIVEDHEKFLNQDLQIDDEIKNETSQEIVQQENPELVTKAKMIEEISFLQEEIEKIKKEIELNKSKTHNLENKVEINKNIVQNVDEKIKHFEEQQAQSPTTKLKTFPINYDVDNLTKLFEANKIDPEIKTSETRALLKDMDQYMKNTKHKNETNPLNKIKKRLKIDEN